MTSRTAIVGSNQITPGIASPPANLQTGPAVTFADGSRDSLGVVTLTTVTVGHRIVAGASIVVTAPIDTSYSGTWIALAATSDTVTYQGTGTTDASCGAGSILTSGLTIKQHATAPATQVPLRVRTPAAVVVAEILNGLDFASYGQKVGAGHSVFATGISLNAKASIPRVEFPDGSSAGGQWWGGTGVPSASTVGTARVGDWYWRIDGGVGTDIYVCTVAGTPGTWAALA